MTSRKPTYLATIGRRGGIRSRRTLTAEQAQAMVRIREARRAAREFSSSPLASAEVPGSELIGAGLRDLADRRESDAALLVSMAAPRLRLLGLRVPVVLRDPEARLFVRLAELHGDAAHTRYNAAVRRVVAFQHAAPIVSRAADA
jgi:hypothetical protein